MMTPEELAIARVRVKEWPRIERVALTKLTEREASTIMLATALLDLRPAPPRPPMSDDPCQHGLVLPVRTPPGHRLKWWLLELLASPRERAIRKQLLRDYERACAADGHHALAPLGDGPMSRP